MEQTNERPEDGQQTDPAGARGGGAMTERIMHFRGRDIPIHTSPEGLDRVARILVELWQRTEQEQAEQPEAPSDPAQE